MSAGYRSKYGPIRQTYETESEFKIDELYYKTVAYFPISYGRTGDVTNNKTVIFVNQYRNQSTESDCINKHIYAYKLEDNEQIPVKNSKANIPNFLRKLSTEQYFVSAILSENNVKCN